MTEIPHSAFSGRQHASSGLLGPDQPHTECGSEQIAVALLSAVSHDLRGPLAAAKAAVETLRSTDLRFTHEQRRELVDAADQSLNRLGRLVENLLDANRLRVGALAISPQPASLAEAIGHSVDELGSAGRDIRVQVPDDLPEVYADAVLLERALVNLLSNALRHGGADRPPRITAGEHRGRVEVRVVDHGPGVRPADWERIFLPFQRLGKRANAAGIGLGLALSRDLVEAMGGTITPGATPGGGLTMTLGLPAADQVGASRRAAA
jgi:two-component system sensor histidine kinase KdpD